MKKNEIVRNKQRFNKIIRQKDSIANKYFVIYKMAKEEAVITKPNFGIAISTKFGNAVERNKYKRIVRLILDETKCLFQNGWDYIIMIKKEAKECSKDHLKEQIMDLLNKRNM